MALANHEVYMIWQIQSGRIDATAQSAIANAAQLMSLPPAEVTARLKAVLVSLLENLPESVLDEVLPAAIEEHYGVQICPPTAHTNHPGTDIRGSGTAVAAVGNGELQPQISQSDTD